MDVSVIGLGAMGRAIAANAIKAGHRVIVWNRSRDKMDELARLGAVPAADVEAALQADIALSVLFDDAAMRAIFLDGSGLAKAAPGLLHANLSTISVALAKELEDVHAAHRLHYVAAPMFGRPEAAVAGRVNFVVAGEAAMLGRVTPVLESSGRCWVVGSRPHHAHLAKIAGNFMISCAIETMAESIALMEANGADAAPFIEAMTSTLFAAPIYQLYGRPMGERRELSPPSGLALPLKDNGLARDASPTATLPLAELLRDNLTRAMNEGLGGKDWSTALAQVARSRLAGARGDRRT
jgi:3-hydroxyisobutyrate dehydrogenase-like beta-hydroxyacid dehydrogenase